MPKSKLPPYLDAVILLRVSAFDKERMQRAAAPGNVSGYLRDLARRDFHRRRKAIEADERRRARAAAASRRRSRAALAARYPEP